MKQKKIILFLLLSILVGQIHLLGQEKKNTITLGGITAHYINNEKYDLIGPFHGYYKFPVDPGFELLYFRSLSKNIKIGTGLDFQKGRVASYMSGLRRFKFEEISVPIMLQCESMLNEKNNLFLTMGIYAGKTILLKAASPTSNENWNDYQDFSIIENYSGDVYFADIYFDAGYSKSITKVGNISIAPFVKYRMNTTWLNYHQKKTQFGLKLIYSLRF
jgi:hypothetical protein